MKIRNYFFPSIYDKAIISKSFTKELNLQISQILNIQIGGIIDLNTTNLHFDKQPTQMSNSSVVMVPISISVANPFCVDCILYWKNTKNDSYIDCTKEIEKGSILFWIEGLDIDGIIYHIKTYSYLQKKVFLEEYRFVVELKNPDIDITFKILYEETISDSVLAEIEELISDSISVYNDNNQKQIEGFEGLIHSFSLKQRKKDHILFKIDLGTAADVGLKFLLKKLDESDFSIKKIEVKGG